MIDIEKYTAINYMELYKENKTDDSPAYQTFFVRIKCGWQIEKALYTPPYKRNRGDEYDKWAKIAEKNGIDYSNYCNRVSRNWDYERAATEPLKRVNKRKEIPQTQLIKNLIKEGMPLTKRNKQYIQDHPEQFSELLGGAE